MGVLITSRLQSRKHQSGQGMLMAILLTLAVGAVTAVLLSESVSTDRLLKGPRIRSAMMSAYNRMRLAALSPISYDCSAPTCAPSPCTPCVLRVAANQPFSSNQLDQIIPYAKCPVADTCGVKVVNPTLGLVGGVFRITATVKYDGTDMDIKDLPIDFSVPKEIVQAAAQNCYAIDPTKPLFAGFGTDGKPICKSLPGGCNSNQYIKSFDNKTLKFNCVDLQPSAGCSNDSFYMKTLSWNGSAFVSTCAPRPDPYVLYGPLPLVTLGAPATTSSPGPNPKFTCTTTTTTTSTTTTSSTTSTTIAPVPTTTTSTTTTTTTLASAHCEVQDPTGPAGLFRGWGVSACTPSGGGFGLWGGNTCNLAATGMKCCSANFSVYDIHGGERDPWPVGTDTSTYWIGLKCVSYDYCSTASDRCVTRPAEQSSKPPSTDSVGGNEWYDF